jgi:hypothetical protein
MIQGTFCYVEPEMKLQLIAVYARVVIEADGDMDSEKLFDQGYHILAPIIKLLDSCSNIPSILHSFEELLEPLIKDVCSRDTEPLFEQVPAPYRSSNTAAGSRFTFPWDLSCWSVHNA